VHSVAVKAPGVGDRRRELLDDLALLTGARVLASDVGTRLDKVAAADLGRARRVRIGHDTTTLIEGGGANRDIKARIAALEREVTDAGSEYERDRVRQRLARLTGGVAVIRVGAPTEMELKERRGRTEDALAATRAALEEGVVAGGGVALLRARAALDALDLPGDEAVGADIVRDALIEPMRQIAFNAGAEGDVVVHRVSEGKRHMGYNAITGDYEDLMKAGVIDPAKVTRAALQNAASIGALVLTTDALVVESDEDEGPPAQEA